MSGIDRNIYCRVGLHWWFPKSPNQKQFCVRLGCGATRPPNRLTGTHVIASALAGIVAGVVFTFLIFMVVE